MYNLSFFGIKDNNTLYYTVETKAEAENIRRWFASGYAYDSEIIMFDTRDGMVALHPRSYAGMQATPSHDKFASLSESDERDYHPDEEYPRVTDTPTQRTTGAGQLAAPTYQTARI